jgi:hypothetical protein
MTLIVRMRRRIRLKGSVAAITMAAVVADAALWFSLAPPIRLPIVGAVGLVGLVAFVAWFFVSQTSGLTSRERLFLGFSQNEVLTLPDLELALAELREERRAHPEIGTLDYKSVYQDDASFYVAELRRRGVQSRQANNTVQIITIVGSLAATGLGSLAVAVDLLRWISPAITFMVGTASGVAAIYKFKDRSFYAQQTANAIDQELNEFNLAIGRYSPANYPDRGSARTALLEEIHRLRTEQENREQNLDQPPQKNTDSE